MAIKFKKKNRSGNISGFSPRKKVRTHLYTKGGEYSLDGVEYIGEYYLEEGIARTGPKPPVDTQETNEVGDPELLNPKVRLFTQKTSEWGRELRRLYPNNSQYQYEKLKDFYVKVREFVEPRPYIYEPKESAYNVGYDERFFVQKRGDESSYAIEVDISQWELIGYPKGIDDGLYAYVSVIWRLSGAYDYIAQQNELALFRAQKEVPSILYSVRNFTEYARFTRF
jgi:hypothetical protein